jgi:Sel1 repeat
LTPVILSAGFESISMKRVILAIFCAAFLASAAGAKADPAADQQMASRYLQAAQSGDDEAQFYLGSLYSAGIGVPRSDEEAFRWFGRAANQGHSHAMLVLAGLYAVGRGTPINKVEAYKWAYIVGAGSRVEEFRNGSRQLTGVLEGRMSPQEINLAKSEAGQWRPVVTARPTPVPQDLSRNAPPPITSATQPAPAPLAPSPQPSPRTSANEPSSPLDAIGNVRKGEVDSFLKEVPSLRKKFGF